RVRGPLRPRFVFRERRVSVEVVTFGCRLNANESEAIRKTAADAGRANLIVVNTCAVTAEATAQARQTIRKLRRRHPSSDIVVTGCAAQIAPDMFAAMPEVTQVLGNAEKMKAETWLTPGTERVRVADIMSVRE